MTPFTPLPTPKPAAGKIMIYDFTADDTSGNPAWYFVGITPSHVDEFLAALENVGVAFDITQYGKILASGEGTEPPQSVREAIYRKYSAS